MVKKQRDQERQNLQMHFGYRWIKKERHELMLEGIARNMYRQVLSNHEARIDTVSQHHFRCSHCCRQGLIRWIHLTILHFC